MMIVRHLYISGINKTNYVDGCVDRLTETYGDHETLMNRNRSQLLLSSIKKKKNYFSYEIKCM